MTADRVAFAALIKELNIKSLVTGDKAARLVLEFAPTDDVLDAINRLHRADAMVSVGIVKNEEIPNGQTVPKRKSR